MPQSLYRARFPIDHIIAEEHEAVRSGDLSAAAFAHLVTMMDDAVRHITSSKNLLQRYTVSRSARTGGAA